MPNRTLNYYVRFVLYYITNKNYKKKETNETKNDDHKRLVCAQPHCKYLYVFKYAPNKCVKCIHHDKLSKKLSL